MEHIIRNKFKGFTTTDGYFFDIKKRAFFASISNRRASQESFAQEFDRAFIMSVYSARDDQSIDRKSDNADKEKPLTDTQAISLMEEYNVKDTLSDAIIVGTLIVVTFGLIIFMWQEASANYKDLLFVEPHKKWSDVNYDAVDDGVFSTDY